MQTETIFQVSDLKRYFQLDGGIIDRVFGDSRKVHAVDGVNFDIKESEVVGLVGESGCGKSTLGRTLLRLLEPTDGTILYKNKNFTSLTGRDLKKVRKEVQIIFQDSESSLNPRKTVSQIISSPMEIQNMYKNQRQTRVAQLLEDVGLNERFLNVYPHQLSGGQRQRVNIARALSVDPEFILCDEVTSALDVSIQAQILNLLDNLKESHDLTMIFITHDLSVIRYLCDRVFVMYLGQFVEKASTEELFDNPKHPYTRSLIKSVADPDPHTTSRKTTLEGDVPSPIEVPSGCRFHPRCPDFIGEICETTEPEKYKVADDRMVNCHLFNEDSDQN